MKLLPQPLGSLKQTQHKQPKPYLEAAHIRQPAGRCRQRASGAYEAATASETGHHCRLAQLGDCHSNHCLGASGIRWQQAPRLLAL